MRKLFDDGSYECKPFVEWISISDSDLDKQDDPWKLNLTEFKLVPLHPTRNKLWVQTSPTNQTVDIGQVTALICLTLTISIHHLLEYDHAIATYKNYTAKQKAEFSASKEDGFISFLVCDCLAISQ